MPGDDVGASLIQPAHDATAVVAQLPLADLFGHPASVAPFATRAGRACRFTIVGRSRPAMSVARDCLRSMELIDLLIITGALLLGLDVGMLLARARSTTQVSELTARAAAAERELAAVRQMHTEQVEAERAAAADRLTAREEELLERLASRERELLEQLETERSQSKARVEEMRTDTKRLADEFE